MIDLPLTDEQATQVAPLLADLESVVCIGSIHPRPYVVGMAPELIGRLIARIGTVPRERILAVRQAAKGLLKARREKPQGGGTSDVRVSVAIEPA
jgi:hypothetical protein